MTLNHLEPMQEEQLPHVVEYLHIPHVGKIRKFHTHMPT